MTVMPDFVFVGLDKLADYRRYSDALSQLLSGAKLIGTNSDRIIATSEGFDVGNGSIVVMLEYASSQQSPRIGKPYAPILDLALEAAAAEKRRCRSSSVTIWKQTFVWVSNRA